MTKLRIFYRPCINLARSRSLRILPEPMFLKTVLRAVTALVPARWVYSAVSCGLTLGAAFHC